MHTKKNLIDFLFEVNTREIRSACTVPIKDNVALTFYWVCSIQVDQATSSNLHKCSWFCILCSIIIAFKYRAWNQPNLCKSLEVALLDQLKCYMLNRKQVRAMLSLNSTYVGMVYMYACNCCITYRSIIRNFLLHVKSVF